VDSDTFFSVDFDENSPNLARALDPPNPATRALASHFMIPFTLSMGLHPLKSGMGPSASKAAFLDSMNSFFILLNDSTSPSFIPIKSCTNFDSLIPALFPSDPLAPVK